MTIYFVLFKCIGNCIYWYCVNYSNKARCIIARVLHTFIFGFMDNILFSKIQIQHLFNHRRHIDQVRSNCNQLSFENTNESVISESISDPYFFNNDNIVSENT